MSEKCIPTPTTHVWTVENKTCRFLFADEDTAKGFICSHSASVAGGFRLTQELVIGTTPQSEIRECKAHWRFE